MAAQIIRSPHALLAGRLELSDEQGLTVGAGDFQPVLPRRDDLSRREGGAILRIGGGKDAADRALELHRGHRPGLKAADVLDDLARRAVPVDRAEGLIEHFDVACPAVILGNARRGSGFDIAQGLHEKRRPHVHEPLKELARGLKLPHRGLVGIDDVAAVHVVGEVHRRDAGHRVAIEHSRLDRRCAPVFGQERAVHVDRAELRQREHFIRQNAPVGHHHQNIRFEALKLSKRGAVAHFFRLEYGKPRPERKLLHRGKAQLHPAPLGLVRLGEHTDDFKMLVEQLFERGRREIRRPHKNDPHSAPYSSSTAARISSSVSMRSALEVKTMPSRWSISWQKQRAVRPVPSTSKGLP